MKLKNEATGVSEILKGDRPSTVVNAVTLLSISLAIGLIELFLGDQTARTETFKYDKIIRYVQIFTFLLNAFVIYKIWMGKNWARMLTLCVVLIGIAILLPHLHSVVIQNALSASSREDSLSLVHIGIHSYAVLLLFQHSSSKWFMTRRPHGASNKTPNEDLLPR